MEDREGQGRPIWDFVARWLIVLVLALFIGAGLGFFFAETAQGLSAPGFESEAMLRVRYMISPKGNIEDDNADELAQEIAVWATRMKSSQVLEAAVKELPPDWGLTVDELFSSIRVGAEKAPLRGVMPRIRVGPGIPVPGVNIDIPTLSIKVTESTPQRSRTLADVLSRVLIEQASERQKQATEDLSQQTALEIEQLESSLSDALAARETILNGYVAAQLSASAEQRLELKDALADAVKQLRDTIVLRADGASTPVLNGKVAEDPLRLIEFDLVSKLDGFFNTVKAEYNNPQALLNLYKVAQEGADTDPAFDIANSKVKILRGQYRDEIEKLAEDRLTMARLGPPLELLRDAPPGSPNPPAIGKKIATAIGGFGGLVAAWIIVNIIDAVRIQRRERNS